MHRVEVKREMHPFDEKAILSVSFLDDDNTDDIVCYCRTTCKVGHRKVKGRVLCPRVQTSWSLLHVFCVNALLQCLRTRFVASVHRMPLRKPLLTEENIEVSFSFNNVTFVSGVQEYCVILLLLLLLSHLSHIIYMT